MHSPTSSTSSTSSLDALLDADGSHHLMLSQMTAHRFMYGRNVIQVPFKQPESNEYVTLVLSQLEFDTMAVHIPQYEDLPPEEVLERITQLLHEQTSKTYLRGSTSDAIISNEQGDSLAAFQSRLLELEYERKRLYIKWKGAKALQLSLTEENTALRVQLEQAEQQEVEFEELVQKNELLQYQTLHLGSAIVKWKTVADCTVQELRKVQQEVAALKEQVKHDFNDLMSTVQSGMSTLEEQVTRRESLLQQNYVAEKKERTMMLEKYYELSGRIRVYCRVRPSRTANEGKTLAVEIPRPNNLLVTSSQKEFAFDQVFGPQCTQQEVYAELNPLVASFMDGYNACILAYGQTGSGKTHTMVGSEDGLLEDLINGRMVHAGAGMIPRALEHVFSVVQKRHVMYQDSLRVSMVEIYNDQILDLLHESNAGTGQNVVVKSEKEITARDVESYDQVNAAIRDGNAHRNIAATKMNVESSRSHALVFLHLKSQHRETREVRMSTLCLVDLAGSERIARSQVENDRLRETQHINKSLAALGDVVYALQHKAKHTPFRNSKLTYMLRDMLSGQAKTLVMLQVSPDAVDAEETTCSLQFGARVSQVQMGAIKPSVETGALFRLQEENRVLETKIQTAEAQVIKLQQQCQQFEHELYDAQSNNEAFKRHLWYLDESQQALHGFKTDGTIQEASFQPLSRPSSPTLSAKSSRSAASTTSARSSRSVRSVQSTTSSLQRATFYRSQKSPVSKPALNLVVSDSAQKSSAVPRLQRLKAKDERFERFDLNDEKVDSYQRRKSLTAGQTAVKEYHCESGSPLQSRSQSGTTTSQSLRRNDVISAECQKPLNPFKTASPPAPTSARQQASAGWLSKKTVASTKSPVSSSKSSLDTRTLHRAASAPSKPPVFASSRAAIGPAKYGTEPRRASLKSTRTSLSSALGTSARRALASSHTGFDWK
ncbi:putative kinesin-like protein [Plasmopara halstedii]